MRHEVHDRGAASQAFTGMVTQDKNNLSVTCYFGFSGAPLQMPRMPQASLQDTRLEKVPLPKKEAWENVETVQPVRVHQHPSV